MNPFVPMILAASDPKSHVVDHPILKAGDWWIVSNHTIMILIAGALCLLIFPKITKPYKDGKLVPTGSRNFFEAIMMFLRNDVAKPLLGDETDRFMPLLWTLFFFIWFMNLLGLIPLDAIQNLIFQGKFHAIYGTATSNFFVTAVLALVVFIIVQFNGIKSNGFGGWAHHFLGGAPWWLAPVMLPVELMGMVIKPFALAVRLAANMTAGHILLAVIIGFVPLALAKSAALGAGVGVISVIAAVAIMVLELFVATLQAYLFTFLTSLFISQMITHHHDDEHHKESEGHEFSDSHAAREAEAHSHGTAVKPAH